ncbi:hypothetical protein KC356_g130 [Hortaea werneckii]|nr:hypothetical protein KC356_g130 [Hortaea werneckii]
MMERLRQAADQTKVTVKMPAKLIGMYGDFITKNAGAVGQVEGALRSLTYIIPGASSVITFLSQQFRTSTDIIQAASENPNWHPNPSTPASNSCPSTMTPSSPAPWRNLSNNANTTRHPTIDTQASTVKRAPPIKAPPSRYKSSNTPNSYWR